MGKKKKTRMNQPVQFSSTIVSYGIIYLVLFFTFPTHRCDANSYVVMIFFFYFHSTPPLSASGGWLDLLCLDLAQFVEGQTPQDEPLKRPESSGLEENEHGRA